MLVVKTINEYGENDFYNLFENSWSGARDTLEDIIKAEKEDEFMDLLDTYFSCEKELTDTELNDFIWFSRDEIYENLGLDENGELITDDDEDDE
jgi:hypothetical protein